MIPGKPRCAHPDCARDSTKRYFGSGFPGRARSTDKGGIWYCAYHYEKTRQKRKPLPQRKTHAAVRKEVLKDVAEIARLQGLEAFAVLLETLT